MVAIYILILCFSTFFTATTALRVDQRLAKLFGRTTTWIPAGLYALVALIAFLTVAAAPAMMLVGTLLILLLSATHLHRPLPLPIYSGGVLMAVLLGLGSLPFPTIPHLPTPLLMLAATAFWCAITLTGRRLPDSLTEGSLAIYPALIALIAAPLFHAPTSIALDAALILSALLGALLSAGLYDRLAAARAPLAYLVAWLILEAALRGAWPMALISALAWCGAIAYATRGHR